MAKRYLLVRGHETALRLVLPDIGSVSIGTDPKCAVQLREAGILGEHAIVHLDFGVGLELLARAEATLEGVVARGPKTVELDEVERFSIGAVELQVREAGQDTTEPHSVEHTTGSRAIESPENAIPALSTGPHGNLKEEMEALEKKRILQALDKHPTQAEAAKALGIPVRTFTNRMDALGIPRARKKK